MFYQKQAIEKHLTCKICNQLFDDPRALPCSHTFCQFCIVPNTSKEENSIIDCPECHTKHQVPPNGFPVNSIVINLLHEQANQVNQSSKIKQLRQTLDSIDSRCKALAKSIQVGSDEIKDYCMSLRQKIDLATETRIEEIRKLNEEFKKQIDDYETDCLKTVDPTSDGGVLEDINSFLVQMNSFYNESNQALNGFEVEDEQVYKLTEASTEYLTLVGTKELLLKTNKFNGHLLVFEPQQSKLELPCLGFFKKLNLTPKISSLQKLNVKTPAGKILEQVGYSASNNLIYAAYQVGTDIQLEFLNLDGYSVLDNVGLDCSIRLRSPFGAVKCNLLSFLSCKDDCVLVIRNTSIVHSANNPYSFRYLNKAYDLHWFTKTFFIKLGKDRRYIDHAAFNYDTEYQAANSSNIFCFDRANKRILVHTSNLAYTANHFVHNIPAETRAIKASEDNLFILHQDSAQMKLQVFGLKDKTVKQIIQLPSLNFNQLKWAPEPKYLIVFNNQNNSFLSVDLNKFTVEDFHQDLSDLEKNLNLSGDDSSMMVFYSAEELKCFISIKNFK